MFISLVKDTVSPLRERRSADATSAPSPLKLVSVGIFWDVGLFGSASSAGVTAGACGQKKQERLNPSVQHTTIFFFNISLILGSENAKKMHLPDIGKQTVIQMKSKTRNRGRFAPPHFIHSLTDPRRKQLRSRTSVLLAYCNLPAEGDLAIIHQTCLQLLVFSVIVAALGVKSRTSGPVRAAFSLDSKYTNIAVAMLLILCWKYSGFVFKISIINNLTIVKWWAWKHRLTLCPITAIPLTLLGDEADDKTFCNCIKIRSDLNSWDAAKNQQHKPAECELYTTATNTHHFQSSHTSLKRCSGAARLAYKRVFTTQTKCPSASLSAPLIFIRR